MSALRERVLAAIPELTDRDGETWPPTANEIGWKLGVSRKSVAAALNQLEADGKVRRLGVAADGSRTWQVIA